MSKPLFTIFTVRFAKNDDRYIKALIFKNKNTMYKFYSMQLKRTGQQGVNDFRAMFQPYEIIGINKDGSIKYKKNRIGNLLLTVKDIGSGVVSHELGHAAFHYWRINHGESCVIKDIEQEEKFLHPLGYLVADFWTKYYKYESEMKG